MPQLRTGNCSWPHDPRGGCPAGGKGLTLDLPGSLIKPRPLETPVAGLGRRSCLPARWPPASHRPAFICSQGADSRQTTRGPAPACDAMWWLRVGCKSPDRPQSGPRAWVPHPSAGQTVAAVSGLWPHQSLARQPSGFIWVPTLFPTDDLFL